MCARLVDRLTNAAIHRVWEYAKLRGRLSAANPGQYHFAHLGEGALIAFPPGSLFGEEWISIGPYTLVGEHVSLSVGWPGRNLGPDLVLRIGRGCSIGRGSHIVAHESIVLGDDVFLAPYVYITDQNHAYSDIDEPIGRQWPKNDAVTIGDGCWLGVGSTILPGTRLGRNVAVAAGAVVRGEFGDHCVLGGVPARVLRRYEPGTGWVAGSAAAGRAGPSRGPHAGPHAGPQHPKTNGSTPPPHRTEDES
jgi:acetyltransferase-like isoleucine patch superfamily enzyme